MKPRPFYTGPRDKLASGPSVSFKPEERVSATTGGGEPSSPQLQTKTDSVADEMPGENPDSPHGEFEGQGDYSRRGEKQPILDYTPCSWMAQQLMASGEPLPQGAVAETREGEVLVSVSVCHECEFEGGCYGMTPEQEEGRMANKTASGITREMPEILVAEKLARMKLGADQQLALLIGKGFTGGAAAGIMRLAEGIG